MSGQPVDQSQSQAETPFKPRRRLWLMRHGAVRYFSSDRQGPNWHQAELTPEGQTQCEAARIYFSGETFDRVLTSSLPRTRQTAERVVPGAHLTSDPDLREIEPAHPELILEKSQGDPVRLELMMKKALGPPLGPNDQFMHGELLSDFRTRVTGGIQRLIDDPSWNQALVVVHSVVLRVLLAEFLQAPLDLVPHLEQDAGCINLVEICGTRHPLVRLINYTPALPRKDGLKASTLEMYVDEWKKSAFQAQSQALKD